MTTPPRVRVHPHARGEWLVIVGGRRLGVPPVVGRRLLDLDGGQPTAGELGVRLGCEDAGRVLVAPAGRRRRRGPWWTVPLVPERVVRHGARLLAPVAGGPTLVVLTLAGGLGVVWGRRAVDPSGEPVIWAAGLVLFILTGLLHEMGHAAALHRAGYPPGGIGLGLVFVLPVLWCDVSAVALLKRRERLGVNLAGPAFQLAAAGALALLGRLSPSPTGAAAGTASAVALAAVAWSLLPFIRADGFWCLSDLSGLGDLDREPRPGESRRAILALGAYRVLHAGFLLLVGGALAWRLAGGGIHPLLAGLVAAGTLALVGWRLAGLRRFGHKAGAKGPASR